MPGVGNLCHSPHLFMRLKRSPAGAFGNSNLPFVLASCPRALISYPVENLRMSSRIHTKIPAEKFHMTFDHRCFAVLVKITGEKRLSLITHKLLSFIVTVIVQMIEKGSNFRLNFPIKFTVDKSL